METIGQQVIIIRLEAFDHRLLDQAVVDIMRSVHATGVKIKGPIPLPTKIERFTVNRSPHIDKESREQFEIRNHYRVMLIESNSSAIEALRKIELASGVDVKIKLRKSRGVV